MNARHRIRLAGPWKAEILSSSSHHQLASTTLKAALVETNEKGGLPFHGQLRLERNFNLPTGLNENSVVWICVDGLQQISQYQIFFNRRPYSKPSDTTSKGHLEISVTEDLENFNRVEIVLTCCEAPTVVELAENLDIVRVHASVWLELL
jgi:hypothetical protein